MKESKISSYYCEDCNLRHSKKNEKGKAICPMCNGKRNDNFNRVDKQTISCIHCDFKTNVNYANSHECKKP